MRYAALRAAREVRTVLIAEREAVVPRHGWLIAVWPDPRAPHLTALDEAGAVLAAADVSARPGMGPRIRLPPTMSTTEPPDTRERLR